MTMLVPSTCTQPPLPGGHAVLGRGKGGRGRLSFSCRACCTTVTPPIRSQPDNKDDTDQGHKLGCGCWECRHVHTPPLHASPLSLLSSS
jgi:hypothetical protein